MNENIELQKKLREWFADRPALTKTIIEKEAGIPPHTLQKFLQGRGFPEKHLPSLLSILKKYGYKEMD